MSGQSDIFFLFFFLDYVHNFPLSSLSSTATSNPFSQKPQLFSTLLYSLVPIIGLVAVVLFSFWMWRHHKLAYPAALVPTHVSLTEKWNLSFFLVFVVGPSLQCVSRGPISQTVRLWCRLSPELLLMQFVFLSVQPRKQMGSAKSSVPFLTVSANRLKIASWFCWLLFSYMSRCSLVSPVKRRLSCCLSLQRDTLKTRPTFDFTADLVSQRAEGALASPAPCSRGTELRSARTDTLRGEFTFG